MKDDLARAVTEVGALLLELRAAGRTEGRWEGTQFKAEADLLAHRELKRRLEALSKIPVLSEEDAASQARERPERYWLIDPIDGTASFVGGFDGFVTQAALLEAGSPRLAAVCAPALQRLYVAEKGRGATLNGKALALSRKGAPEILIDNCPQPRGSASRLFRDLGFKSYLESGSIGLKICRVADGGADVFFKDVVVRDWDVAAPELVLEEAGGCLVELDGAEFPYRGGFEHPGLIAARSREIARAVLDWRAKSGTGGV